MTDATIDKTQRFRKWLTLFLMWLLPLVIFGLPVVITVLTALYPDWNPWAVARVEVWLEDKPKWVLVALGSLIAGWWVTASSWYKTRQKSTAKHKTAIKAIKDDKTAAIEKLATEHTNAINRLEDKAATTLGNLETKHSLTVDRLASEKATTIDNLKTQHGRDMKLRENSHSSKMAALESHMNQLHAAELATAKSEIERLEEQRQALLDRLALPHPDDQMLFDRILTALPTDSSPLGWLYFARFNGSHWRRSDMIGITDFTTEFENHKFIDSDVNEAWTELWNSMNDFFWGVMAEAGPDREFVDGDAQCEIKNRHIRSTMKNTISYDEASENNMELMYRIIAARDNFPSIGRDKGLSLAVTYQDSDVRP